jgi:hypothetical protein
VALSINQIELRTGMYIIHRSFDTSVFNIHWYGLPDKSVSQIWIYTKALRSFICRGGSGFELRVSHLQKRHATTWATWEVELYFQPWRKVLLLANVFQNENKSLMGFKVMQTQIWIPHFHFLAQELLSCF